jgi:hypothetical protein
MEGRLMGPFYVADGLAFRVDLSTTGLDPSAISAATGAAFARLGTTTEAGTVTIASGIATVDFGAGALPTGRHHVQVQIIISGRPATVAEFDATIRESLIV